LFVDKRGVGHKGRNKFRDKLVISLISTFTGVDSKIPKYVPEYFTTIAQQVFIRLLDTALEIAGKDCDDTLIDIKVDVLVLGSQLEN
jgi:hypothetical protein